MKGPWGSLENTWGDLVELLGVLGGSWGDPWSFQISKSGSGSCQDDIFRGHDFFQLNLGMAEPGRWEG